MKKYCLDANVFIQAKNGPYAFDIVPVFWDWLDRQIALGVLMCPEGVYAEVVKGDDDLADWMKERRRSGILIGADLIVQAEFGKIADYVSTEFPQAYAKKFLSGADPWVVAVAKAHGATVVTHEAMAGPNSHHPKIPNVCKAFGVPYVNCFQMLRELGARF